MVRIKHRYLLFNILYPSSAAQTVSTGPTTPAGVTLFLRPSPAHLTSGQLISVLRAELSLLFGDHGLSMIQAGLRIVYFSPTTSTGILRVPRAHFRIVWAALSFVTSIPAPRATGYKGKGGGRHALGGGSGSAEIDTPCVIRVVRVSGTIRKSEEELLRRARRDIVRAKIEGRDVVSDVGEKNVLDKFAGLGPKGKQRAGEGVDEDLDDEEDIIFSDDD
jgi:ribonuclease P/MRP protein subunit POP5